MRRAYQSGGRLVLVMCCAEILCMAGFATFPALLSRLSAEWSLTSAQAGLISGVLFLGYVLGGPILTGLTDRVDARRVYLCSTLVCSLGSLSFALIARGFAGALFAQALFGIGFAGIYMPGLKALSDRIEESRQSRAVAMYTSLSGIGLAGSYAIAGLAAGHLGWRAGFAFAAFGPVLAGVLVFAMMSPKPPAAPQGRVRWIDAFGQVLGNRPALGYILAYTAHCWELYGTRSWLVAFLAFVQLREAPPGSFLAGMEMTGVVGLISLTGIFSSIYTNEFAGRLGRARLVILVMLGTAALNALLATSWSLPMPITLALAALYYAMVMADSGALTAGTVAAARPGQRGATLAVHSTCGFSAGLFAPFVFGFVLDCAGGIERGPAWMLAILTLAAPSLLGAFLVGRLSGAGRMLAAAPAREAEGPSKA